MSTDLEKLREIFVADTEVDEETRVDNLAIITEWEKKLRQLGSFQAWKTHPITIEILKQARKSYADCGLSLARDRNLTEGDRASLFAKQDAALWIISLASKDVQSEMATIHAEIRRALLSQ